MKVASGRQISNECCFPGCKERVWYYWDGTTRLYCDEHGGVAAVPLTAEERRKKHNKSGGKSFDRKIKNEFRVLRKKLLPLGVDLLMSDYITEKLSPLVDDFKERKAILDEKIKPLLEEQANLDSAIKDIQKTLSRMTPKNNVTPISRAKKTGETTLRDELTDILRRNPEGKSSAVLREMTGRNGTPSELSAMKRVGLVDLVDGVYRLKRERAVND
jgi:hypothetical protein